jgi:hypothetical protein
MGFTLKRTMCIRTSVCFCLLLQAAVSLRAQTGPGAAITPKIEEKTRGMVKLDGYFPLYWDERAGLLWLEIPRFDTDFLYITGLAAGLGSNDIGLDRGQAGDSAIVYFERIGNKVFLVRRNEDFRSTSPNAAERRSVEESFAKSVLKSFPVGAESDGHVWSNATGLFVSDGYGAAEAMRPGKISRGWRPERGLPGQNKGVSEEHRGGSHADLCSRKRRPDSIPGSPCKGRLPSARAADARRR